MELNSEKTKIMIFNFSKDYKFTTNISLENEPIEVVNHTRLLGTILTTDLKWNMNTNELVRKAYARMQILHKIFQYKPKKDDMTHIYKIYIRSILEQSCQVWHSSLSEQNCEDLEKVQKCVLKIIEPELHYQEALFKLNLESLRERRDKLCLKFAKKSIQNTKTMRMFPENELIGDRSRKEKYKINYARTERLKRSSIPYMQRLLNQDEN